MSPSKTIRRANDIARSPMIRFSMSLLLIGALASGCSESVDVKFRLVPPCSDPSLVTAANCAFVQVVVWALDPNDPLHPSQTAVGAGPLARTCAFGDAHCKINGGDLVGAGRMVDVLCKPTFDAAPVARASSGALLLENSSDGAGGLSLSMLLGPINGFIDTTVTNTKANLGECSLMGQDQGRYGHASIVLDDGRVLTTGGIRRFGQGIPEILSTAEIYDPETGQHRQLLGSNGMELKMNAGNAGRAFHTMTRLRNGKILIAGGVGKLEQGLAALRSAELFDPATETFTTPMDMGSARAHHAAVELDTGLVLLTGGATYAQGAINNYLATAVLYNPDTGQWTPVNGDMSTARAFHQAVALDPVGTAGRVVVVGGENAAGTLQTVDIFNPDNNTFYSGVDVQMSKNRSHFCAVRLSSGRVLVAGGTTVADDPATSDVVEYSADNGVEIYDPNGGGSFGAFTGDAVTLTVARMDHTCSLLEDGNVLVAGGLTGGSQATGVGELIRDQGGVYSVEYLPDQLDPARYLHSAVTLRNGWVLLNGGLPSQDSEASALRQSLLFVPSPAF